MAWNDGGDGNGPKDPWGRNKPNSPQGNGERKSRNAPDIDDIIKQGQDNIRRMMGGGSGNGQGPKLNGTFLSFVFLIGIALWAATGFTV